MKRILPLLLALLLLPLAAVAAEYAPLPDAFNVAYTANTRLIKSEKAYVSKEYVTTAQPAVDAALKQIADRFDNKLSPTLTPLKNPARNSRLDINVLHSVSGKSLVSFQVLARVSENRKQLQSPFECHTYDMTDGHEVFLTDLFPEDSQAWTVMADAVRSTLDAYFPHITTDKKLLDTLCLPQVLLTTDFTLTPASLTLHYPAETLYPGRPTIMHVQIPYSAFKGMMTDYGTLQTDNNMYRLVALTYDDGPTYTNTARLINTLRHAGARATFFVLGNLIDEYPDITMREHDENHSVQSHHWSHVDSSKSTAARLLSGAEKMAEKMTQVIGAAPIMMRPPYGTAQPFAKAGVPLPQILWNVDTKDWVDSRKPNGVLKVVRENTVPGSIILMHDITDITNDATALSLEWLRKQNYLCVTVQELAWHYGTELGNGKTYSNFK